MSKGIDSRIQAGYIGFCCTRKEMLLTKKLLAGIPLKVKQLHPRDDRRAVYAYSFWTSAEHVMTARDMRRGFKAGLQISNGNNPYAIILGIKAALEFRMGYKKGKRNGVHIHSRKRKQTDAWYCYESWVGKNRARKKLRLNSPSDSPDSQRRS